MEIETGAVYEHDRHGQIVVLGIHRVYQTYETDSGEGELDSIVVRWAEEWDDYGPIWSRCRTERLDAFLTGLRDPIGHISFRTS
jgi:hypothetical protein